MPADRPRHPRVRHVPGKSEVELRRVFSPAVCFLRAQLFKRPPYLALSHTVLPDANLVSHYSAILHSILQLRVSSQ